MELRGDDVSQDAAVLALNAIELVRVSLAGLWPSPPEAVAAAPPEDKATAPSPGVMFTLGLGIAVQQDIGLPSPEWMGSLTARMTWARGLGIQAQVGGLGSALTLNGPYGTATVHRQFASLGITWTFLRRTRVQSFVVLSVGAVHLAGEGTTNDPSRAIARTGDAWSALGEAGIGATLRLSGRLCLAAELDALATLPPLIVRIADTDTKPLSHPGVMANVGLHVTF
jgi:hypothetical protein